jgi:hypothetical protein
MHLNSLKVLLIAAAVSLTCGAASATDRSPKKMEGPEECAECHRDEAAVWRATHHHTTFREMPRSEDAEKIAKKMRIKRIKSESLCLNCHFTNQTKGGVTEPIAGISCELCHSAGKDWIKLHAEFSGNKKKELESKQQAALRWKKSEQLGMIRPRQLYKLAKNCYGCHVVPQEKLVNVGEHTPGSKFELVSWSQGEVRHNVWYTEGKENKKASANRKRMMYIIGMVVEYETAIRAVGKATEKKTYAIKMAKRAAKARKKLSLIAKALPKVKELANILKLAKSAKLKLNNNAALTKAADRIAVEAVSLSTKYDGSKFAKVDSMIPGPKKYKGKPAKVKPKK